MPADDVNAEPTVLYPGDESRSGFKPVYSPDGSRIAFGCKLGLCVMDADGSNVRVVVEWRGGSEINHFDWTGL